MAVSSSLQRSSAGLTIDGKSSDHVPLLPAPPATQLGAPHLYEAQLLGLDLGRLAKIYGRLIGFPLATDWLRFRHVLACLPSDRQGRVLDIGCGNANMLFYLARSRPGLQFLGVDLDAAVVERNRAIAQQLGVGNVVLEQGDWRGALEGRDESFDLVLLMDVLTEVPDPAALLGRIAAVLRPGGCLVLGNAMPSPLRAVVDAVDPYWQAPTLHAAVRRLDLLPLVRGAGFRVEATRWLAGLPFGVPAHCLDMLFYKSRGLRQALHAALFPFMKAAVALELLVPPILPTGIVIRARKP